MTIMLMPDPVQLLSVYSIIIFHHLIKATEHDNKPNIFTQLDLLTQVIDFLVHTMESKRMRHTGRGSPNQ